VNDRVNGRLLQRESTDALRDALQWLYDLTPEQMQQQIRAARKTADDFSMTHAADNALECFESLRRQLARHSDSEEKGWENVMARIKAEWEIIRSVTRAGDEALSDSRSLRDVDE
jgi:hypothetical protein